MSCKVLNREAKPQRCTRRFREQVPVSEADDKSQKENKRTKWENPKTDDSPVIETQNEGHMNDDDDGNSNNYHRSIEGVGIKMLRESSCLLPPSQPVLLRSGKKEDISRETMVTPNRTSTRQEGGIRKVNKNNFYLDILPIRDSIYIKTVYSIIGPKFLFFVKII